MKKFLLPAATAAMLMCLADVAMAVSVVDIKRIAQSTAVKVDRPKYPKDNGSGVIIRHQGDLYTLVTNRHVVCGGLDCDLSIDENYKLELADGRVQTVRSKDVKLLGKNLDLAVIQFRSKYQYSVAQFAIAGSLKVPDTLYASGFPREQGFRFSPGEALAVANIRLTGNNYGYTIIYNANTQPGMSGGGVFNQNGQLVAIHGKGEVFKTNTLTNLSNNTIFDTEATTQLIETKLGINRGISVQRLTEELLKAGVNLSPDESFSDDRTNRLKALTSADDHFTTGFNKFVNPDNNIEKQQAIQEFSQAISLNPKYAKAYHLRGLIYQQLKEFKLALQDGDQLVALRPNDSDSYLLQASARVNVDDLSGALISFNQAISISPQEAGLYYARASFKMAKLKDLAGAISDYNQAIKLDDQSSLFYHGRCVTKIQLQDLRSALADCNKSISLDKESARYFFSRATLHILLRNSQSAIADFDQVIKTTVDNDANIYKLRGRVKALLSEDYDGALKDYNEAIRIGTNNGVNDPEAYQYRAELQSIRFNKPNEALADYDQIISRDALNAKNYADRGFARLKKGDFSGALADHNQVVALSPNNAAAYGDRGWVKNETGDTKGALADYNRALSIDPTLAAVYNDRAVIKYDKLNDTSGALIDCNKAISLNSKEMYAYNLRGRIKAEKFNDFAGALADYNIAIGLEPNYHRAYYNRGVLRIYQLGDKAMGIQDLRRAAKIFRGLNRTKDLQEVLDQFRKLGITENN
jgi:tetratricopeptide (TPR) repeat protein